MSANSFFNEQSEQSAIKSAIIKKYFWVWAKVMLSAAQSDRIAYIDLFAGPGRYEDGKSSTPLLVLESAINDSDNGFRNRLVTLFNDKDEANVSALQQSINSVEGIEKLKYKPQVINKEVGAEIVKMFESMNLIPTLFFVDPWGYKGLSLRLINSVLKNWGCDCVFFLNYNRINMGVNNNAVEKHMEALFEVDMRETLRPKIQNLSPEERELVLTEEVVQALKRMGGQYVLPFRFKDGKGKRTSHYLVFVTKHFKGYEIMKEIMAKESSEYHQGVPSFEYTPATKNQPMLFELNRPLDDLRKLLTEKYKGKTKTMLDIYLEHSVDTPYIKANYKDLLNQMEEEGVIVADPPAEKRPNRNGKKTFADRVKVQFL